MAGPEETAVTSACEHRLDKRLWRPSGVAMMEVRRCYLALRR
ncbi:MAG: hypothetical protein ACK44L_10265 [Burkholderiales bacterium]